MRHIGRATRCRRLVKRTSRRQPCLPYTKTGRKDPQGRVVYTKKGVDYVRRKQKDGQFAMRRATAQPVPATQGPRKATQGPRKATQGPRKATQRGGDLSGEILYVIRQPGREKSDLEYKNVRDHLRSGQPSQCHDFDLPHFLVGITFSSSLLSDRYRSLCLYPTAYTQILLVGEFKHDPRDKICQFAFKKLPTDQDKLEREAYGVCIAAMVIQNTKLNEINLTRLTSLVLSVNPRAQKREIIDMHGYSHFYDDQITGMDGFPVLATLEKTNRAPGLLLQAGSSVSVDAIKTLDSTIAIKCLNEFAESTAEFCKQLYSEKHAYYDFKLSNVMLMQDKRFALTNFEVLAKLQTNYMAGTLEYMGFTVESNGSGFGFRKPESNLIRHMLSRYGCDVTKINVWLQDIKLVKNELTLNNTTITRYYFIIKDPKMRNNYALLRLLFLLYYHISIIAKVQKNDNWDVLRVIDAILDKPTTTDFDTTNIGFFGLFGRRHENPRSTCEQTLIDHVQDGLVKHINSQIDSQKEITDLQSILLEEIHNNNKYQYDSATVILNLQKPQRNLWGMGTNHRNLNPIKIEQID